jgi:hypothetical protein
MAFLDPVDNSAFGVSPLDYRKPLAPAEMKPLTERLLGYGTSGLQGLGSALSYPGDIARSLLAGRPGTRTTGRELLNRWGLTNPYDKGWGSWGAGLATDILTDPLSYTSFGAKHLFTPVGKVISKLDVPGGALANWGRRELLGGFHATESELRASGKLAAAAAQEGLTEDQAMTHLLRGGRLAGLNPDTSLRVASAAQEKAVQDALGRGIVPGERLSGLAGIGIPWGPRATFGGGALGRGIAHGLDIAGEKLMYAPGVKQLSSLFAPSVAGALDEASQRAFRGTRYRPGGTLSAVGPWSAAASARGVAADFLEKIHPILQSFPDREEDVLNAAMALGEGAATGHMDQAIVGALRANPETSTAIRDWYREGAGGLKAQRLAGAPVSEAAVPEGMSYIRREAQGFAPPPVRPAGSLWPRGAAFDEHRKVLFTQAGGMARINDWAKRGANEGQILQDLIRDQSELNARRGIAAVPGAETATSAAHAAENMPTLADQAREIAGWVGGISGRTASRPWWEQTPYSLDITGGLERYGAQAGRKLQGARAFPTAVAHLAMPFQQGMQTTHMPLPEVLERMGFETSFANPALGIPDIHGMAPEVLKALAPKGAPAAELFTQARPLAPGLAGPAVPGNLHDLMRTLGGYGIPRSAFEQLQRSYARASLPEQLKSFVGPIDTLTNAFKSLAFPIWPAAHSKKAVSELITALRTSNPLELASNLAKQAGMMREAGLGLPGSAAARRAQYATGAAGLGMTPLSERAGLLQAAPGAARAPGLLTPGIPLAGRAGPTGTVLGDIAALPIGGALGTVKSAAQATRELAGAPRSWRDILSRNLGMRGVGGTYTPGGEFVRQAETTLPLVRAGEQGITNVSDAIRGAQFRGLVGQGYSPARAAQEVNKYQFDYGNLTRFEKDVMRRLVPFYTFASRNIPLQLETLATRPGIPLTQLRPFIQDRDHPAFVPSYMAGKMSLPLGPGERPGTQQFLQSMGLPIEEALSPWTFRGGWPDWRRAAQSYLGLANPLLKAPLEQAFDTQLFSGRRLSDLQAPTTARFLGRMFGEENPQLLAQVLANTPATRFMTTLDRLLDPRKSVLERGINLLTGAHITDVDVERQRAIEARNALESIQSGMPHVRRFQEYYIPQAMRPEATPEEIEASRVAATQQQQLRNFIEQRRRMAAGLAP